MRSADNAVNHTDAGDGLLTVSNPYLNWELKIDSRKHEERISIGAPMDE